MSVVDCDNCSAILVLYEVNLPFILLAVRHTFKCFVIRSFSFGTGHLLTPLGLTQLKQATLFCWLGSMFLWRLHFSL